MKSSKWMLCLGLFFGAFFLCYQWDSIGWSETPGKQPHPSSVSSKKVDWKHRMQMQIQRLSARNQRLEKALSRQIQSQDRKFRRLELEMKAGFTRQLQAQQSVQKKNRHLEKKLAALQYRFDVLTKRLLLESKKRDKAEQVLQKRIKLLELKLVQLQQVLNSFNPTKKYVAKLANVLLPHSTRVSIRGQLHVYDDAFFSKKIELQNRGRRVIQLHSDSRGGTINVYQLSGKPIVHIYDNNGFGGRIVVNGPNQTWASVYCYSVACEISFNNKFGNLISVPGPEVTSRKGF